MSEAYSPKPWFDLPRPWRIMTPEEYAAMPLLGPHMVERNYDGCGATAVWLSGLGPANAPSQTPAKPAR